MAYKRSLPTFNKDPEIQRTQVKNPDGTITYKSSWSATTPGTSSSIKRTTPMKRTTASASSSTRSIPAKTISGKREDIYIPGTKLAGIKEKPAEQEVYKKQETSLQEKKKLKEERVNRIQNKINTDWLESNRGKTLEDKKKEDERYKKKQTIKAKRSSNDNTDTSFKGMFKTKKAVKPCTSC